MKKVLFIFLFLSSVFLINADHSKCRDPHCLGLLATVSVDFSQGGYYRTVTIPVPPEGIKNVYGAMNPRVVNNLGSTVDIELTYDESCVGHGDVSFDVVTNKRGTGTSVLERDLFYHVEIKVNE